MRLGLCILNYSRYAQTMRLYMYVCVCVCVSACACGCVGLCVLVKLFSL